MKLLRILLVVMFLSLAGCRSQPGAEMAATVAEQYLQALAGQDTEAAQQAVCDELRAFVLDDLVDFADVMAQVDNVACEVIESGDGVAQVVCTGTSTVIGDPEVLALPPIDRIYLVEQREQDWLICGIEARE